METKEQTQEVTLPKYDASMFDFKKRPVSYSTLKHILKSPLHFSHNWFEKKELTPAMIMGRLVDTLLLEPEKYANEYIIRVKFTGTGSVAKNAEWAEANAGKMFITQEQKDIADKVVLAIKANPKTAWLVNSTTEVQKRIQYKDKKTGIQVIMYLDGVAEKGGKKIIWDLKTTADASHDVYERQAAKMGYHLQGGVYVNGMLRKTGEFCDFYQIVAETKEPFAVNCYRMCDDMVKIGQNEFRKAIDRVAYCVEHNTFGEGYEFLDTAGYDELDLPIYIKRQLED